MFDFNHNPYFKLCTNVKIFVSKLSPSIALQIQLLKSPSVKWVAINQVVLPVVITQGLEMSLQDQSDLIGMHIVTLDGLTHLP